MDFTDQMCKRRSGLQNRQNGSHDKHNSINQLTFVRMIGVRNMEEATDVEQILKEIFQFMTSFWSVK